MTAIAKTTALFSTAAALLVAGLAAPTPASAHTGHMGKRHHRVVRAHHPAKKHHRMHRAHHMAMKKKGH